ncbi:MAG: hypothetical protein LIR10_08955 [Bacillota bacterium]|nr:hypothetical protein [Bacillota bacterium]
MSDSTKNEVLVVDYDIYQLFKYALLVRFEQRFREEVGISFADRMRLNSVLRNLKGQEMKKIVIHWAVIHDEKLVNFGESDDQLDQMIMFVLDKILDEKGDARNERLRKHR